MALFDDLMGALKKALEDKAKPTLTKLAEVMDEFEVGVELARRHGQTLIDAARRANEEVTKRTAQQQQPPPPPRPSQQPASGSGMECSHEKDTPVILDAEIVEDEPKR